MGDSSEKMKEIKRKVQQPRMVTGFLDKEGQKRCRLQFINMIKVEMCIEQTVLKNTCLL
jgi:hypothetical protein